MPRDSSGNYSLPAGNPVVSNTTIEATWANTTMDDIASALTDSLDRQGRGGMLAPFRFADGTISQPSITWTNETNTGFYRAGTEDMRAVVGGVDAMRWIDDGGTGAVVQILDDSDATWKDVAHENSTIRLGDGTISAPALTWFSEATDGFYRAGAGDQRYAQDVASTATDIIRYKDGVSEILAEPYDSGTPGTPEWLPAITSRLTAEPAADSDGSDVASTGWVRGFMPIVAAGRGDGNSSTFIGQTFGVAGWNYKGTGSYELTLSASPTAAANLVVIGTIEGAGGGDGDNWLHTETIGGGVGNVEIDFKCFIDAFNLKDAASISFIVLDMGLINT